MVAILAHAGPDDTDIPLNGTVSVPPDMTIKNSTMTPTPDVKPTPTISTEPDYSSKYLLYSDFSTDDGTWSKRDGTWRNGFANVNFRPSNVKYSDGKIQLLADVENHSGAEADFMDHKFSFGTYKASMKLTQTQGTYMALFSYQWSAPNIVHNEIDIELFKNADGTTTAMFSTSVNHVIEHTTYKLPFDPGAAYHVYAYKWYPDRVEYYIDDMSEPVWTSHKYIPQDPMYVELQDWTLENPGDYGSGYNRLDVDWVTVEPL